MYKITRKIAWIPLFAMLAFFHPIHLSAQEGKAGHSHHKAEMHGGSVAMSKMHHFEVVFKKDQVQVYLYDLHQNAIPAKGVSGKVTLKFRKGEAKTLPLEFVAAAKGMEHHEAGEMHEHGHEKEEADHEMGMSFLRAKVDLSKVKPGQMKAVFSLSGLPNAKERAATFTETFRGFSGMNKSHHDEGKEHHH
ncbi:MAG: hypothetical protein D6814_07325 [Calditrichaeota bacterium]|nr:MAG: hypothetical protein D6814_07325 [Calditrichota bacterium]